MMMRPARIRWGVFLSVAVCMALCTAPAYAQSRNASFINPNSVSAKSVDGKAAAFNTVVADPATIDAGETLVNVARRITVFFFNGFRSPIQMNDLTLNADGNVRSKVVSNDCLTIKTLPVQDKCSVALEITPSSPGPWSVELLLNHSGTGRIARAEVNGSTLGKADEKAEGLAISKKIAVPLDFGSVTADEEKAARTMLIENDSTSPLLISSIDLIATDDQGLSVRKTGCKEGDELKPGESCPITVMWEPVSKGNIATDLIVRHSGNLGFVVVPIRGNGTAMAEAKDGDSGSKNKVTKSETSLVPSASGDAASQMRASLPSLDALPLPKKLWVEKDTASSTDSKSSASVKPPKKEDMRVSDHQAASLVALIGTVGDRAILSDSQEQTHMVSLGGKITIDGIDIELMQLDPVRAVVMIDGKRINLSLRNSPSVIYNKNATGKEQKKKTDALDGSAPETSSTTPVSELSTTAAEPAQASIAPTAQDVLNLVK